MTISNEDRAATYHLALSQKQEACNDLINKINEISLLPIEAQTYDNTFGSFIKELGAFFCTLNAMDQLLLLALPVDDQDEIMSDVNDFLEMNVLRNEPLLETLQTYAQCFLELENTIDSNRYVAKLMLETSFDRFISKVLRIRSFSENSFEEGFLICKENETNNTAPQVTEAYGIHGYQTPEGTRGLGAYYERSYEDKNNVYQGSVSGNVSQDKNGNRGGEIKIELKTKH
jgi:hypothetical protein